MKQKSYRLCEFCASHGKETPAIARIAGRWVCEKHKTWDENNMTMRVRE